MTIIPIFGYIDAFCTTISFVPQAVKTIKTKDTRSISLPMYLFFNIGILFWLIYGILINDLPIILANGITLSLTMIILALKLKYK